MNFLLETWPFHGAQLNNHGLSCLRDILSLALGSVPRLMYNKRGVPREQLCGGGDVPGNPEAPLAVYEKVMGKWVVEWVVE